jgi:hypothetical protein
MNDAGRQQRIEEALSAAEKDAARQILRIPWRDGFREFPVVRIPLDAVVLNPHSHRIKAHIEASDAADLIRDEPFSDAAQHEITEIIKQLAGNFDDLKANLSQHEQNESDVHCSLP